jgi:hypothetical protein
MVLYTIQRYRWAFANTFLTSKPNS